MSLTSDKDDAQRYRWLRRWYMEGRPRSEIDAYGYIAVRYEADMNILIDKRLNERFLCNCYDKAPTIPVFRNSNEHLPDCPAFPCLPCEYEK